MSRERLLSEIVPLSPTGRSAWGLCRRQFLLSQLLGLRDASGDSGGTELGLMTHQVLRLIHENGTCQDEEHVASVVEGYGASTDRRLLSFVERHALRCPVESDRDLHEYQVARFHRAPSPMFMGIAQIDAIWVHDGILDARDYKTGSLWLEEVRADAGARLQAWILARYARRHDLTVRLRYEYLAAGVTDDPEPFEPDDDDLEAITEELRGVVEAMWAEDNEGDWSGVADVEICGRCDHRKICRDSAAPDTPTSGAPGTEKDDR